MWNNLEFKHSLRNITDVKEKYCVTLIIESIIVGIIIEYVKPRYSIWTK